MAALPGAFIGTAGGALQVLLAHARLDPDKLRERNAPGVVVAFEPWTVGYGHSWLPVFVFAFPPRELPVAWCEAAHNAGGLDADRGRFAE